MITSLQIFQLRNIKHVELALGPNFNVLFGLNGSGKTSFLEAIHILTLGRSFRTPSIRRVIQHDADKMTLHAQIGQSQDSLAIGVERHRTGKKQIRLANDDVSSFVEIAKLLPLQLFDPNSCQLLNAGPKLRRQFLDWGVFHVEQKFFQPWQRLKRALQQRNAALRKQAPRKQIQLWDDEVISTSEQLDLLRQQYLSLLMPVFSSLLQKLLPEIEVKITYQAGWDHLIGLRGVLRNAFDGDLHLGYTQYGAHRADLVIIAGKIPVEYVLSRGQLKLVAYAMKLAQGQLLQQLQDKTCAYLFDELAAELDIDKCACVHDVLQQLNAQVFITGVDERGLSGMVEAMRPKVFHVEQGMITPHNNKS